MTPALALQGDLSLLLQIMRPRRDHLPGVSAPTIIRERSHSGSLPDLDPAFLIRD